MASPDSSTNDLPDASRGGRANQEPTEMLASSAQILQALTALVDSNNAQRESNESRFAVMEGCLLNIVRAFEEQTRLHRRTLAELADPASAVEPASRQGLQVERSMLWRLEVGVEGRQADHLPRPSIIGRALYDLQQAEGTTYEGSSPADIYITISVSGRHHLSDVAVRHVERYQSGERRAMSGKINEHLEPRFEALSKRSRGRYYADNAGTRRSLTVDGCRMFADWPHWSARDDDFTGDGRSASGFAGPVRDASTT